MQARLSPLSLTTRKYLEAQFNPFGSLAVGACIPDAMAYPSQKIMLRKRGILQAHAKSDGGGRAYITLNPFAITKDGYYAINHSQTGAAATVAGEDHLIINSINAQTYLDTPYTAAQMVSGKSNRIRVVGAGIRLAYTSQWDELKGNVIIHSTAAYNNDLYKDANNTSDTDLLNDDSSAFGALSHNVTYTATMRHGSPADCDYINGNLERYGQIAIVVDDCKAPTGFGGTVVAGASFAYDVIVHLEMIGEDANGLSPSYSDPIGLGKVTSLPRQQYLNTPASTVAQTMAKLATARKRRRK